MDRKITRREFISSSVAATAALSTLSCSVLEISGRPAPSDRVNLAFIGVGDMGMGNLNDLIRLPDVEVVAVCDVAQVVDYSHVEFGGKAGLKVALEAVERYKAEQKKSGTSKGCAGYTDFREMLDKETDIDSVVVSTPDHIHAVACMAAINKGKHVYCEKPLTHSVYETRMVTEAARKVGVATQRISSQGGNASG